MTKKPDIDPASADEAKQDADRHGKDWTGELPDSAQADHERIEEKEKGRPKETDRGGA